MSESAELPPKPDEPKPTPEPKPVAVARSNAAPQRGRSVWPVVAGTFVLALVIGAGVSVAVVNRWPLLMGAGTIAQPAPVADVAEPAASVPAPSVVADVSADLQRTINGLQGRIDTLENRLAAAENRAAPAQSAAAAITGINSHLDIEDSRLAALEAQIARTAQRDALAALEQRLGRLEAGDAGDMMQRAATILARANLARAAQGSVPFKRELAALMAIVPDDPAVSVLQPVAESGAPTLETLRARFAPNAREALNAERNGQAENFWARLWARVSRLISVRRVGDVSGTGSAELLARAEADLDRDDLSGAVGEVRALTGPAGTAMMPWLKDADARLALDRGIADLESRIVQALAAPSGTR